MFSSFFISGLFPEGAGEEEKERLKKADMEGKW